MPDCPVVWHRSRMSLLHVMYAVVSAQLQSLLNPACNGGTDFVDSFMDEVSDPAMPTHIIDHAASDDDAIMVAGDNIKPRRY